jgi:hypothetical protein
MSYIDREDLLHWLKRLMQARTIAGDVDGYLLIGYIRRLVFEMPEAGTGGGDILEGHADEDDS